jgi:hypothetical protein
MLQSKGVSIPGLGTFTFVQKKLDVSQCKYILIKRPVLAIAEKFAKNHDLAHTKYPVSGSIPVHPINYTAIANELPFSRDDIEASVRYLMQMFNRNIQWKKNVELTFDGVGKLLIRNGNQNKLYLLALI